MSVAVFEPEVWADAAAQATGANLVLANLATAYPAEAAEPGSVINFPRWEAVGDLDAFTRGSEATEEELAQTSVSATFKPFAKSIPVYDVDVEQGVGDPAGAVATGFGIAAARKIDDLLRVSAVGSTSRKGTRGTPSTVEAQKLEYATVLDYAALVDALALLGDADAETVAGLVIAPAERAALSKDSTFLAASNFQGEPIATRGFVGTVLGVPVYVSGRQTAGEALLIRKGALAFATKRAPRIEPDRQPTKARTVYTCSTNIAVARVDENGIVRIVKGTGSGE